MGVDDTETNQEFRHRFRYHCATTVGVDGVRQASIVVHGFVEKILRRDSVLHGNDQQAGGIAILDVEDAAAFVRDPFRGSLQCGDFPRPHLTGLAGD